MKSLFEKDYSLACVQPISFFDSAIGQQVGVHTTKGYLVITIGQREYFFCRESGEYDGYGDMHFIPASPILQ
jgi:hypothetical protein